MGKGLASLERFPIDPLFFVSALCSPLLQQCLLLSLLLNLFGPVGLWTVEVTPSGAA